MSSESDSAMSIIPLFWTPKQQLWFMGQVPLVQDDKAIGSLLLGLLALFLAFLRAPMACFWVLSMCINWVPATTFFNIPTASISDIKAASKKDPYLLLTFRSWVQYTTTAANKKRKTLLIRIKIAWLDSSIKKGIFEVLIFYEKHQFQAKDCRAPQSS